VETWVKAGWAAAAEATAAAKEREIGRLPLREEEEAEEEAGLPPPPAVAAEEDVRTRARPKSQILQMYPRASEATGLRRTY